MTGYMRELAVGCTEVAGQSGAKCQRGCYRPYVADRCMSRTCVRPLNKWPDLDHPPCSGYERWSTKGPFVHACLPEAGPELHCRACRAKTERIVRLLIEMAWQVIHCSDLIQLGCRASATDRAGHGTASACVRAANVWWLEPERHVRPSG
jgi:hypothetical protein